MTVVYTSGLFGAEITVEGLEAAIAALDKIDPKLVHKLHSDLRRPIEEVRDKAAAKVDSQTGETAAGYKVTRRGETFKITNRVLGAVILENWRQPKSLQGEHLIATLNAKYGADGHGRILWDTWTESRDEVERELERIVADVEDEIQREVA